MTITSEDSKRKAAMRRAWDEWWRIISRRGDPLRRPDLASEAFEAGYLAGIAASPADDVGGPSI